MTPSVPPAAPLVLSPAQARQVLVAHHGLAQPHTDGPDSVLQALGALQLDPIDRIGPNADLVLHARCDGLRRGAWRTLLGTGQAFEHIAKERCVLPAHRFPWFAAHARAFPSWRIGQRLARLDPAQLDAVCAEVRARGPLSPSDLSDHGRVQAQDWSGWVGTSKAGTMAMDVLTMQCRLVVVGRSAAGERVLDVPERALPRWHGAVDEGGDRQALMHRVQMCGLLAEANGPPWRGLEHLRGGGLVASMLAEDALVRVRVGTSRRAYLTTPHILASDVAPDARLRILPPLDPLLWDRALVRDAFAFEYVWEVYKPAHKRRFGYYVCPLLHHGQLVGRFEARRTGPGKLEVLGVWGSPDAVALEAAIERLRVFQ